MGEPSAEDGRQSVSEAQEKTALLRQQAEQITSTMQDNVARAAENHDDSQQLAAKANELSDDSKAFTVKATAARRKMCFKNAKISLLLGGLCVLFLLYVLYSIFGGIGCDGDEACIRKELEECIQGCGGDSSCIDSCA